MADLHFIYRDAAGAVSQRVLTGFTESGHYVEGVESGRFLTFRKDRVVEYLNGCDRGTCASPFYSRLSRRVLRRQFQLDARGVAAIAHAVGAFDDAPAGAVDLRLEAGDGDGGLGHQLRSAHGQG